MILANCASLKTEMIRQKEQCAFPLNAFCVSIPHLILMHTHSKPLPSACTLGPTSEITIQATVVRYNQHCTYRAQCPHSAVQSDRQWLPIVQWNLNMAKGR